MIARPLHGFEAADVGQRAKGNHVLRAEELPGLGAARLALLLCLPARGPCAGTVLAVLAICPGSCQAAIGCSFSLSHKLIRVSVDRPRRWASTANFSASSGAIATR